MSDGGPAPRTRNVVGAAAFILLGSYTVWEARQFGLLGAVTPMFIGSGMIMLATLLLGAALLRPGLVAGPDASIGSFWRRLLLGLLMAVWVAALPWLGFLLSSLTAFLVISLAVPRVERWTARAVGLHALGGLAITLGFWAALKLGLDVPLPAPAWM